MVAIAAAGSMDPEFGSLALLHIPPGPEVDPADKICGRYPYASSRREGGVDLVL